MQKLIKNVTHSFVFIGLVAGLGAVAAPLATIEKTKTLRIATEGAFNPFNYFKGKELTGFEVDLANEISKKLALKSDWKTQAFDSLLIGLNQDRYDLVAASHGITPERSKAVDFTNPHYCTGGVIVTKAGGPTTIAGLKGKKIAVQVGSTYLENVKKISGVKTDDVKTFPKDTDSMQSLLSGRVDAWVTDKFVALDSVKAHTKEGLKIGDMVFQEKIAMAVAKGNTGLRDKVNDALASLIKDGSYAKLSQKYFAQDISCK